MTDWFQLGFENRKIPQPADSDHLKTNALISISHKTIYLITAVVLVHGVSLGHVTVSEPVSVDQNSGEESRPIEKVGRL